MSADLELMKRLDDSVSEVSLLLPGWQANALQQAAYSQGLTIAQLVRRLLSEAFAQGKHLALESRL